MIPDSGRLVVAALAIWAVQSAGAVAADAGAFIGTPIVIDLPPGFVDASATPGFIHEVAQAQIEGVDVGAADPANFDDPYVVDLLRKQVIASGIMSVESVEVVPVGDRKAIVLEGARPLSVRTRVWAVFLGPGHSVFLTFAQSGYPGLPRALDRATVLKLLATVRLTAPHIAGQEVLSSALTLRMTPPFTTAMLQTDQRVIELSTSGSGPGTPHITVSFPPGYAYRPLATLARDLVQLDAGTEQSAPATFIAMPAIRRAGQVERDGEMHKVIEYVSIVAGQPVLLVAESGADEMSSDVIGAVDAIAQSARRQTGAELQAMQ